MPVLVCFSGLPGEGKTTWAKALAAKSGALYLRIDEIEAAMRASHMACGDLADGGYAAAQATARAALNQGFDVVADSVNPNKLTRDAWRHASHEHCHLDVWLTCDDRSEHRLRVEARTSDMKGAELPNWGAVEARRFEVFPEAAIHLDTGRLSVEEATVRLHAQMLAAKKEDRHV